jgi:hypothetical protein
VHRANRAFRAGRPGWSGVRYRASVQIVRPKGRRDRAMRGGRNRRIVQIVHFVRTGPVGLGASTRVIVHRANRASEGRAMRGGRNLASCDRAFRAGRPGGSGCVKRELSCVRANRAWDGERGDVEWRDRAVVQIVHPAASATRNRGPRFQLVPGVNRGKSGRRGAACLIMPHCPKDAPFVARNAPRMPHDAPSCPNANSS